MKWKDFFRPFTFKVIDLEVAEQAGLIFVRNVYGDEINFCDCRSFWTDNTYLYRVHQLYKNDQRTD